MILLVVVAGVPAGVVFVVSLVVVVPVFSVGVEVLIFAPIFIGGGEDLHRP